MPRAPATLDVFAAVAEPRRRAVLDALGSRRKGVTQLVDELHWPQPMVSKHLAVLRGVGLVTTHKRGREVLYEIDGQRMKTLHDWARRFEKLWDAQLLRIKARAEAKAHQTKQEKP